MDSVLTSPPESDELEVSVFGPGYGECIVLHFGSGDWAVVDSCIDGKTAEPVALEYLKVLGVDYSRVVLIVATHWHDDHIRGIGDVFAACKNARFACSAALSNREWATIVELYKGYLVSGGSGVDEFGKVLTEMQRRKRRGEIVAPQFAISGRDLLGRSKPHHLRLSCLAPSDAAIAVMHTRIRKELMPHAHTKRLRVPVLSENDSAVVLGLTVGDVSVLLGADLEERGRPGLGWQVILENFGEESSKFVGLKVPHHGSVTGHHPGIWERLMNKGAWAVVTPFSRLKNPLPSTKDCLRIASATDNAYLTAPVSVPRFRHANPAVQRTVSEVAVQIGPELTRQGHVRLRRSIHQAGATWRTELFGKALKLSDVVAMS